MRETAHTFKFIFRAFAVLLLLGGASGASWPSARAERRAATLAQYRQRVAEARAIVETEAEAAELDEDGEGGLLSRVRALLPREELVEWPGGPVGADNNWLHDALAEYEQTADERNAEQRAQSLRATAARLRGLEARLAEAGAPTAARDKEAEKGRLAAILRRPEYARQQQGDALRRQLQGFFEWLRSLIPDIKPLRPGTTGGLSRASQLLVFGLAAAVLGYVLWSFWRRRERGAKSVSARGARVVLGERLEADQTAADLLEEAERLARDGQLRAAIRKAYVALLCELGDRKVIGLARHKTNRDYLQAVRQRAPRLYPALLPLTSDFELHWYGAHEATESDWSDFRARCREALRAI